jgi:outer membrane protein TolC
MNDVIKIKHLPLLPVVFVLAISFLNAQEKLTLEQALMKALRDNPDLAMDGPAREAAISELASSRSSYLPRLDMEQSVLGGNNPVYVFGTLLTQRGFTAANFALPSLNNPDPVMNLQTRVMVQQNVWDFGRTKRRVEGAQLGVEITDRSHEEHTRQTLLEVVKAYYAVSLSHEIIDAAGVTLKSAMDMAKQAQARVESGLAVEADLLRSQVYLASARQQDIQAKGQGALARAVLNRLMGDRLDQSFGETAPLTRATYSIPSEGDLLAELQKSRPDYLRLQAEAKQAEIEAGSKHAQLLPTLGAFAAWEVDNPSFKEAGGSNWLAGMTLRWNVYSGGGDSAQLQATRHRLEQKHLQIKAMESAMALEVHKALIQVRSAEQQVSAMQAAEAQSQEGLRILKNRYEAGLATMTDLLSAESARGLARSGLAQAIYQHRISYAELEFAAGTLSLNSAAMK